MKQHKYELFDTALYDYQFIQQHLTDMAAQGWRLDKVSTIGYWRYRRSAPAQVRYEVTYAASGSAYNSRPTDQEEALTDLCAEAGWVKVAALAQMHIYCNEDPKATPLETDELTRIQNIKRSMGKGFLREQILMIVLFLIQLYMQVSNVIRWPSRTLASPLSVGNVCMIFLLVVLFAINLAAYLLWIRRAENAAREGLPCPSSSFYRKFRYVLWLFVAAYLVILLCSAELWLVGGVLVIMVVCVMSTRVLMALCKKLNSPKWVNIAVPFCVCFLMTMGLLTGMIFTADGLSLDLHETPEGELPLTLSDLGLTAEGQSEPTVMEHTASIVGSYGRYWDESADGELRLRYLVIDVGWEPLYTMCLNEQERDFLDQADWVSNGEIRNQSDLWGAHYARHAPGDFKDCWFICWDGRIVSLSATWPLTEEQIAIAAELLGP